MKSILQAGKTLASDNFNSYNHVHLEKVVWEGEGWAILEPVSKPSQLPRFKGSLLLVPAQGRVGRNVTLGNEVASNTDSKWGQVQTFQIRELLS